jgi:HK97 family phage prohead protease
MKQKMIGGGLNPQPPAASRRTLVRVEAKQKHKRVENFSCAWELKSLNEEGRFAGYASVFDVVDSQSDVMQRGAFAKSLKSKRQVKLLWQHQMDEPIGIIEKLFEDERGLYVEGRLLLSIQRAREAYDLVKAGALEGMSIGYTPVRFDFEPQTGIRRLQEVSLWEISLVTFPANAAAGITVIKSGEQPLWLSLAEELDRAIGVLRG